MNQSFGSSNPLNWLAFVLTLTMLSSNRTLAALSGDDSNRNSSDCVDLGKRSFDKSSVADDFLLQFEYSTLVSLQQLQLNRHLVVVSSPHA